MGKVVTNLIKVIPLLSAMLMTGNIVNSQTDARSGHKMTQTELTKPVNDVHLLDAKINHPVQTATCQFGVLFNSFMISGTAVSINNRSNDSDHNNIHPFMEIPNDVNIMTDYSVVTLISLTEISTPGFGEVNMGLYYNKGIIFEINKLNNIV